MNVDQYAVMGNPIGHSKSPLIHTAFAEQTGQALQYTRIEVALDGFAEAVRDFADKGGKGLNITVPFKLEAFELSDTLSERAQRAAAVNTLSLTDNGIAGDNTDGVGLVRDLTVNHDIALRDKRLLILGAGGAVQGILAPLLGQQPAEIVIANRTVSKAEKLAQDFSDLGKLSGCGFDADLDGFDVVLNGTAAGLNNEVPPVPENVVHAGTACYDLMYGSEPTAFVKWANRLGAARALDGLGMLVEQAAESFYIWRGVRPETAPVIKALR